MTFFEYIVSLGLTPSDWVLFGMIIPITWFIVVYGFFTKWFLDPLGWFLLSGALGLWFVLALVIYGVFTGERVPEVVRFLVFTAIFVSWVGQDIIMHNERRNGRLEKRLRHERTPTGPVPTIDRKETA